MATYIDFKRENKIKCVPKAVYTVYYIYHKKVLSVTDFRLKHVNCYSVCVGLPERERERIFLQSKDPNQVRQLLDSQKKKKSKTAFNRFDSITMY